MKLECQLYDICLPDYFPGHHLPYVQISVWRGMSLKEIKEQIRSEIHQGAIGGSGEDAYLLASDWLPDEKVKEADKLIKAAHAAINRIKPAKPILYGSGATGR